MRIRIDHIAKIEGHASFVGDIVNNSVEKARVRIDEGARLFEGILAGRKFSEIPAIASRICGVCPVVHNLTVFSAMEKAFGAELDEFSKQMRKLMMMGQLVSSHATHIFFFSLADFFGFKSDLELFKKYPRQTKNILKIKEAGDKIVEIIGGRTIHPLSAQVGGMRKIPRREDLIRIGLMCSEVLPLAEEMAHFFSRLHYPPFRRKMNFISLGGTDDYAIARGNIKTSEGDEMAPEEFLEHLKEIQPEGSVAKLSKFAGKTYMCGALARINNNADNLNHAARTILEESALKKSSLPSYNPFFNILAQAVEIVHCLEEALELVSLGVVLAESAKAIDDKEAESMAREGRGVSVMEAPRGLLFYDLEFDGEGILKKANIITPTAQNLANMEEDLKRLIPGLKEKERENKIKMLIRAYDPCITCATH